MSVRTGSVRLRTACDECHRMKTRCSGDIPCQNCLSSGSFCNYSYSKNLGRPRGTKNRRTVANGEVKTPTSQSTKSSIVSDNGPSPPLSRSNPQTPTRPSSDCQLPGRLQRLHSQSSQATLGTQATSSLDDFSDVPMFDSIMDEGFPFDFGQNKSSDWEIDDSMFTDVSSSNSHCGQNYDIKNFPSGFEFLNDGTFPNTIPRTPQLPTPPEPVSPLFQNSAAVSISSQRGSIPSAIKCSCLQDNATFLCSLKTSEIAETSASSNVDAVLARIDESMRLCRNFIECRNCTNDHDQEVVQLALMSIRILLLRLQRLATSCSKPSTPRSRHNSNDPSLKWLASEMTLSVGTFEISGNERWHILQFLLFTATRKIRTVLGHFKTVISISPSHPSIDASSGVHNVGMTQHMLQNLELLSQNIEKFLQKSPVPFAH